MGPLVEPAVEFVAAVRFRQRATLWWRYEATGDNGRGEPFFVRCVRGRDLLRAVLQADSCELEGGEAGESGEGGRDVRIGLEGARSDHVTVSDRARGGKARRLRTKSSSPTLHVSSPCAT